MPKQNRSLREVDSVVAPALVCTFKELAEAIPSLQSLMKLTFPAQQSYHIAKLARLVDQEFKSLTTQRDALIKELGEDVEPTPEQRAAGQGTYQRVKPANLDIFKTRTDELNAVEVTIPWDGIRAEWLRDREMAPEVFYGLDPLLVGEMG